jgi:hypothetical protein
MVSVLSDECCAEGKVRFESASVSELPQIEAQPIFCVSGLMKALLK